MSAIETTGRVDDRRSVRLDEDLPDDGRGSVRVIILFPESDEPSEAAWLRAGARNPVFADPPDPAEDDYTLDDGRPFVEAR